MHTSFSLLLNPNIPDYFKVLRFIMDYSHELVMGTSEFLDICIMAEGHNLQFGVITKSVHPEDSIKNIVKINFATAIFSNFGNIDILDVFI